MLKVFVTRGFPFWDAENRIYITEQPTEVQDSEWLQAQIEAGLIAVAEVLCVTPAVRNMIREGKHFQVSNLIQTGAKQGMVSMERSLAKLVREGVITHEVGYLKSDDPQLFENYFNQPNL